MSTAEYGKSRDDRGLLRRTVEGAAQGIRTLFGQTPEAKKEEEEKKVFDTWVKEMELAEKFFHDYHDNALRANNAFLDEQSESLPARPKYKLNLFNSNVSTMTSIMYAKLPKVEADRRFADPSDDVGRVAGVIVTRILQNDMNDPEDKFSGVLKQALQDRLVAGLGSGRVRYCLTEKDDPEFEAPEGFDPEKDETPQVKEDEWCDIEYVHWRDVMWSPCRTPAEMRWIAFRCYMTKGEITARFGEDVAKGMVFASRGPNLDPADGSDASGESRYTDQKQAEVWEIWDRASRCVYWYVKGYDKFLDHKDDPLSLPGFFPNAPSMVANCSTMKYLPKPDYLMAEDLYDEINELESRIALLSKACKVVGVYPASATEIKRILNEATENEMVPVENWAMFADKGGLKGQMDWYPIQAVAEVLVILVNQQANRIQQLYQVTGMSDIIRGQATQGGTTATEQRIKAQFASTRMQSFTDEFANFATEILNRKVCLIRKFYDPERIKKLSNIMNTPDAEFADAAIALIKNQEDFDCRVVIRSESMAQIDYEALKMERGEFMAGVASFLGSVGPILEQKPEAAPFLMELLKFNLAGMKGASEMEGVFDRGIAALKASEEAKQANPQPSPEEKAQQAEIEGKVKVEQVKAQAKGQADAATAQQEMALAQQEHTLEMERMRNEMQMDREEHALKIQEMEAKIQLLFAQLQFKQRESEMKLEGQQVEQQMDAQAQSQEMAHDERRMEMDDEHAEQSHEMDMEHSDRQFEQQERHAEAEAKRESKLPRSNPKD